MKFNKSESAGYLANHMARLFARGLHQRVSPLGLAPAQFMTLVELWAHDGLTQRELVDRLDVEQATIANTLARMQRDGLITRKPHPKDGRAQSIFLTRKAKDLRSAATTAAAAQNKLALSGLSDEERRLFLKSMRVVIKTMKSPEA